MISNILKNKKNDRFDTFIAESVCIEGNIEFVDSIFINGKVKGNINTSQGSKNTSSHVQIGPFGSVEGTIFAHKIEIIGSQKGDVHAFKLLTIHENSTFIGNAYYTQISVEAGASCEGKFIAKYRSQEELPKAANIELITDQNKNQDRQSSSTSNQDESKNTTQIDKKNKHLKRQKT